MITEELKIRIERICSDVKYNEPMSLHTTFKTGGPAECYVRPNSSEGFVKLIRLCEKENLPFYIVGNGSNLLVSDEGLPGVVVHLGSNYCHIGKWDREKVLAGLKPDLSAMEAEGKHIIYAAAGAKLSSVAAFALKHSLAGLEFAAGIPGSAGGAFIMNAGAYDGEISQVCAGSIIYDFDEGRIRFLPASEQEFGYRSSVYQKKGTIVLYCFFALEPGNEKEIRAKIEELGARRREKQPLEYPSAGSTFKRPDGHFAGKLIEDAGLRGCSVGGARVSEKHCGFIINTGNASSADIMALIRHVRAVVLEKSGVKLEPEVKFLGNFN